VVQGVVVAPEVAVMLVGMVVGVVAVGMVRVMLAVLGVFPQAGAAQTLVLEVPVVSVAVVAVVVRPEPLPAVKARSFSIGLRGTNHEIRTYR